MKVAALLAPLANSILGLVGKSKEASAALADKLGGRRGDWVVMTIFTLWAVPMVHGYIDPTEAAARIGALDGLPEWYRDTFIWLTIFGMGYPLLPKGGR